jgi:spore germination cell wall hydrolase CwlJ-like protein
MWRDRLRDLESGHRLALACGGLAALVGAAWYIGALASPLVSKPDRLYGAARPAGARPMAKTAPVPAGLNSAATAALAAPQAVEQLTADQAVQANALLPVSTLPNPPARPFKLDAGPADRQRALTCLTMAVYYEAGNQGPDGEAAVAQVVLNRLRHPLFPKTVCGVVFEGSSLPTGCQFTFACDGSLARRPSLSGWKQAAAVAERALDGFVDKPVGEATHYHTIWVVPYWRSSVVKLTQIGAHVFYRWPGGLGGPGAFQGLYAGAESTAPPPIPGFDTGAPPVQLAKIDPPALMPVPAPAAPAEPVRPIQVALLTTPSPAPLVAPPPLIAMKPRGYFGGSDGGGQRLPVPSRW